MFEGNGAGLMLVTGEGAVPHFVMEEEAEFLQEGWGGGCVGMPTLVHRDEAGDGTVVEHGRGLWQKHGHGLRD